MTCDILLRYCGDFHNYGIQTIGRYNTALVIQANTSQTLLLHNLCFLKMLNVLLDVPPHNITIVSMGV